MRGRLIEAWHNFFFALEFIFKTRCTQSWLLRVWGELLEYDIHQADPLVLEMPDNPRAIAVSAFASQVHVRFVRYEVGQLGYLIPICTQYDEKKDDHVPVYEYEFAINFDKRSGLYVHEKFNDGNWELSFQQRNFHFLGSTQWVKIMRLIDANLDLFNGSKPDKSVINVRH